MMPAGGGVVKLVDAHCGGYGLSLKVGRADEGCMRLRIEKKMGMFMEVDVCMKSS